MSYSKLRGRIREICKTEKDFAEKLGISPWLLSKRLTGQYEWKGTEIAKSCSILGIPLEDVSLYFFCEKGLEN